MRIRNSPWTGLGLGLIFVGAISGHGGEKEKIPLPQPKPNDVKNEPKKAVADGKNEPKKAAADGKNEPKKVAAPKLDPAAEFKGIAQASRHPYKMEKGEVYRITVKADGFVPLVRIENQRGYDPTLSPSPFLAGDITLGQKPVPRREAQLIFLAPATRVYQIQVDQGIGSEIGPGANSYTLRIERASFKPLADFQEQQLALGDHAKKFEKGKSYGITVTGKGIAPLIQIMDGSRPVTTWTQGRWVGFGPDAEYIVDFTFNPVRTADYRVLVALGPVADKRAAAPAYTMSIVELKMALSAQGQITFKDPIYPGRGGRHKVHAVKLEANKTYQIDLISHLFDPYLFVEDSTGKLLMEDDDSAGNLNARIVFTPKKTDTYRIVATTFGPAAPNLSPGAYTLTVVDSTQGQAGPAPADQGAGKAKNQVDRQ